MGKNRKKYHGCYFRNKKETRKMIDYATKQQYVFPTNKPNWGPVKEKYQKKIG